MSTGKIQTHRRSVPWSWTAWMTLPWVSLYYLENVSNSGPLIFTLRKFFDNPMLIGFITSLNGGFNFLIGAVTSYMSDRIWTRFGRRRPFLIVGWLGVAGAMACIPLATNGWSLIAIIVVYQICADIAKPVEPLYNEVIPPSQRGRAAIVRNITQSLTGLLFFSVLLAQYDHRHTFDVFGRTIELEGETILYWAGSGVIIVAILFLCFRVKETPPSSGIKREPFRFKRFFRELFCHREQWVLYALYAAPLLAAPGVDFCRPLLQTEQLGFSKSDLGYAASLGLVVSMVIFYPLAGLLTDRLPRLRLIQIGLIGPAVVNFTYFLFLRYYADYSISFYTLVAFGFVGGAFSSCLHAAFGAMIFDYIPTHRFGTVSAGLTFIGGIIPFLMTNLASFWFSSFTAIFGTRGGGQYDYSSIFILQLIGSAVAVWITFFFAREERCSRIIPHGRLEIERQSTEPAEARTSPGPHSGTVSSILPPSA